MYLRFLKLATRSTDLRIVQEFYQQEVLPLLQQHSACRFASLLQATSKAAECISMTLWDSPEEADRYEQSAAYLELLEEGAKLISASADWSVRLADDTLATEPRGSRQETIGDAFTVEAGDEDLGGSDLPARLYLRIVSVRVKPEKWDDLIDLYNSTVLPTLRTTQGCHTAFLVEALHDPDQALSVSIWNREEDAIRYEMSGTFDDLTRQLRDTLEGSTRWKVSVGPVGTTTSPPVRGYKQIVGEKL